MYKVSEAELREIKEALFYSNITLKAIHANTKKYKEPIKRTVKDNDKAIAIINSYIANHE
jgi:hypothetical protein